MNWNNVSRNLPIIKLPNGVFYVFDRMFSSIEANHSLFFAMYGVKSKGTTLVIDYDTTGNFSYGNIRKHLVEKNLKHFDRIFIVVNRIMRNLSDGNMKRHNADAGITFRDISSKVLLFDIDKWEKSNNIKREQINWFYDIIGQMMQDNRFLLGQINDRMSLAEMKSQIAVLEDKLEKRKEELRNLQQPEDVSKTNLRNIMNMKWINKIEAGPEDSLRILTNPMACTYVPNIARYIPLRYFEKEDILYRIMKYQMLGKYFIVLPDYYIISNNFNIRGERNDRYPKTRARNVMIKNTYFHGMACHIGNGQACVGELGAAISGASKNGLDMLLMSFEVYLRSINLPDAAGQRYYVLPMGDENGNIEVWPYVEDIAKRNNVSLKDLDRTLEGYEKLLSNPTMANMCESYGKYFDGSCESWSEQMQESNLKQCLDLIHQREPDVYEKIMERVSKGVVL